MTVDFSQETLSFLNFLRSFLNRSSEDLGSIFSIHTNAKNKNSIIIKKICEGYKGHPFFEALIEHENIMVKTVNLNEKGFPEESMSFPAMDLRKILKESWEDSEIRALFSKKILFCIFQRRNRDNIFVKAFLWNMPGEDLDGEVKKTWEKTKGILLSGDIIKKQANNKLQLNFPKESQTNICHIRPHGRNGCDLSLLEKQDNSTNFVGISKQSFWLNKKYIVKIITKN